MQCSAIIVQHRMRSSIVSYGSVKLLLQIYIIADLQVVLLFKPDQTIIGTMACRALINSAHAIPDVLTALPFHHVFAHSCLDVF